MKQLTWGLVVCTYKREDILSHCLRLAAEQTLPPVEVINVDANPNFERSRSRISAEIVARYPAIQWNHLAASRPSLPAQRNYGIRTAEFGSRRIDRHASLGLRAHASLCYGLEGGRLLRLNLTRASKGTTDPDSQ